MPPRAPGTRQKMRNSRHEIQPGAEARELRTPKEAQLWPPGCGTEWLSDQGENEEMRAAYHPSAGQKSAPQLIRNGRRNCENLFSVRRVARRTRKKSVENSI